MVQSVRFWKFGVEEGIIHNWHWIFTFISNSNIVSRTLSYLEVSRAAVAGSDIFKGGKDKEEQKEWEGGVVGERREEEKEEDKEKKNLFPPKLLL